MLENPDVIAEELKRQQEEGPDAALTTDLETARREHARCEKKQADYLRRFSESEHVPWELIEREVSRLEVEKAQWAETVADLEARLMQQQLAVEQLASLHAYCERVRGNLDAASFEEKRLAFEALAVRVSGNGREWSIRGRIPVESAVAASGIMNTTSACYARRLPRPPAPA